MKIGLALRSSMPLISRKEFKEAHVPFPSNLLSLLPDTGVLGGKRIGREGKIKEPK